MDSTSGPDEEESPPFFSAFSTDNEARDAILAVVHQDPRKMGVDRTRWTLHAILSVCCWLKLTTGGLSKLLGRVGISYKRSLDYILSPDPNYAAKLEYARELLEEAEKSDGRLMVGYLDELSYFRQPSPGTAYEQKGHEQPHAMRSTKSNTLSRVVGIVNAVDGKLSYHHGSKVGVAQLVGLYRKLVESYPDVERFYILQDNWPVHFHADLLAALEAQQSPWPMFRPANWSDTPSAAALRKWGKLHLPVQIVPLPTYAPWTNYTEKLWRLLKQQVLHTHRLADDLVELRALVMQFLDQFSTPSEKLLRYIGLLAPD